MEGRVRASGQFHCLLLLLLSLLLFLLMFLLSVQGQKGGLSDQEVLMAKAGCKELQAIKEQKFPLTTSTNNYASVKPKLFVNVDGASLFLVQDVVLNGVTFCCKELIPDLLSAISQCL